MVWNPVAPCDLPPPPDRRRRRRRLFPDYSVLEPAQIVRIAKALGREDVRHDILVSLQRPSGNHDAKLLIPPQTPTIREESPSAVICSPIQRQAPIAVVVVGIERLEISPHDVVPRREVAYDAELVVARRLAVFGPGSRVDDFDGGRELVAQPLAVGGAQERMSGPVHLCEDAVVVGARFAIALLRAEILRALQRKVALQVEFREAAHGW